MKMKKLTNEDLEQDAEDLKMDGETRENIENNLHDKQEPIKLKPQIFKRSGFKRITGGIVTVTGTILTLLPKYTGIGQAVMGIGAVLGIGGSIHGAVKNKKSDDKTQILMTILKWVGEIIIKLLNKKEK